MLEKVNKRPVLLAIAVLIALTATSSFLFAGPIPGNNFTQKNLVSDIPGVAQFTDPNLVNPWGMSMSGTSPIWVSDNGTGLATIYNGAGVKQGLVVTVPPPAGGTSPSAPTGQVFNGGSDFGANRFIFATEDGTISAWKGGTSATLQVDNSASGAVYKGLALGNNGSALLYAANFNSGNIDVFNSSFAPVTVSGGFTDPNLPAGYAPFDIQNIGGNLYVTYALQDGAKHDDVAGAGNGFVDVFDANGNLIQRLITQGDLNSPWGLAVAPTGFGNFGGDLLVGNFGDGMINVYNKSNGTFVATLSDAQGNPIVDQGLWGLTFGNGGAGGKKSDLYFTAGIPGPDSVEDHGLFGVITNTPEPSSLVLLATGIIGVLRLRRRRGLGFDKV